jgi:putative glutamine amidotransferase
VESAGGVPVLIPLLSHFQDLEGLLPRLDGILFSGGVDLQPSLYREEKLPETEEGDPVLDDFETELADWALQEDVPILGVCRGMQLLNVVLGGNLYQDIPTQYKGALNHCRRDLPRTALTHRVELMEGSLVASLIGSHYLDINSLHHQAVKDPGQGVVISGRAADGIAEILEVPARRFVLALQGHPEEVYGQVPAFSKIFAAFVAACANLPEPVVSPAPAAVSAQQSDGILLTAGK